jgi:hypothetical protein
MSSISATSGLSSLYQILSPFAAQSGATSGSSDASQSASTETASSASTDTGTSSSNQTASQFASLVAQIESAIQNVLQTLEGDSSAASTGSTGTSSGTGSTPGQPQGFWSDFQQLGQALQSGNLSDAQQAYSALSQTPQFQNLESQASANTSASASTSAGSGEGGNFASALTQIGSDLQSGDLSDAQSAFTSLQQQLQANAPPIHANVGGLFGPLPSGLGGSSQTAASASAASSGTTSDTTSGTSSSTASGTTTNANSTSNPYSLISQIFSAIDSVLQQNGIGSSSSASGGTGSSSISDLLAQNGTSPDEFRQNVFASFQQGGGSNLDWSQMFQNFSSGQSINVTA